MATVAQSKYAERLVILNEFGTNILERLHQTYRIFTTKRPAFLNDPTWAKFAPVLLKKFPEFEPSVDKVCQ